MDLKVLRQLFSLTDLRNVLLGSAVVFGGLALAGLMIYAPRSGNPQLTGIVATISLIFILLILIFIVPPLARNAGKEASQMNLPFEFTTGGAIMLGLIMIVGFSAWNTGNNLLFLVLSFLSAAMVVGFLAGSFCLKKMDVKMRFPETIFAGQETPILVSVHNRKRAFPSFSVVAEVRGNERERSIAADDLMQLLPRRLAERLSRPPVVRRTLNYFVHIPRNQSAEGKIDHIFQHRGRFLIKDFELSTKFPFGFFRHRRRLPARETELIVFPKLLPFDQELENMPLEMGKLVANKRGLGQDLLALRDYQPNDDLRRIDWKATARTRHLTVREFSAEDDKRITVFLDTRVPDEHGKALTLRQKIEAEQRGKAFMFSARFERGVSQAASLLGHFTEQQADIRIVIDSEAGEFGMGSRHLYDCLKRLAVVEPRSGFGSDAPKLGEAIGDLLDDKANSHNFLVTTRTERDFPPEMVQRLKLIRF